VYLKRLDVQGFKSFANKTTLEFGEGITCVVGPNGTGKTNVADSLRWVLGEHASRALRARKTEDVIFAGSDRRAPMGVAEVSIALDNSNQWLPIDFNEVVVTRRAYRNGENEYLINHSKVRLRDVVDLFMRAQVGQNSYAFMGQGMVEQALSLRPEDRRALIEEAADVRMYRNKLEDARGKLKATRENMERVRLLVREIEPRITQLERQSARAIRYHELAHELAATLHVWYAHQWRDVNEKLLASITTHDQRSEALERAGTDVKSFEGGLTQLRAAIDERRREIASREQRLRANEDYLRDLERRNALDEERARMIEERTRELTVEVAALEQELAMHGPATTRVQHDDMEPQLAAAGEELVAQRERVRGIEHELAALQREALHNEHAAARARAMVDELARRSTEAADQAARLRREADAAREARRRGLAELAAWGREFARLQAEAQVASGEIEQAGARRARLLQDLERSRHERTAAEDELRSLRTQLESTALRLEVIESMDVRVQPPDAGVRAILEAGGVLRRDAPESDVHLEGVVGLLGQLLRVPSGLERAIEAALAENLFAIVFRREADMREAVRLLLDGDNGRATMYALDAFQESRPLHLIKERGVLGVASALVRCDSKYRRLFDTLLGRTVIVEDLALAQRFVRRGLAGAVATTDGVLLRPIGAISAGSSINVQSSMAHDRELGDLPERIAVLQPQITAREASLDALAHQVAGIEQELTHFERATDALRERRASLDRSLGSARNRRASMAAALLAAGRDTRARSDELADIIQRKAEIDGERDARVREALVAEEKEQGARRRIAELEAARAMVAESIAECAATVARLEGQLRFERQATAPDRAARERLENQIAGKRDQGSRLTEELRAIAARVEATTRERDERSAEVVALRDELEPARQELAQFESRERSLTTDLVEAGGRLREAERGVTEAEHDVRLLRDELESLRVSLESEGFVTTDDGDVARAPDPEPAPTGDESEGDLPAWMRAENDGGIRPIRGGSTINPTEVRDRIAELRAHIRSLGPVNEQAATDYVESRERYDFLTQQLGDLQQADEQLTQATDELEQIIRARFRETFKVVNREFERYFNAFFRGGTARLELGENDEDGLPGVDIIAQPPGKKLGSLALLSGGERSLTAVALLFALLQANPSPICVLDEVDAALDEANVGRFVEELRQLAKKTQFIIITHNRRTIEIADTIYGVSMGGDSASRILGLKLADIPQES
jgi:chromosome segregation protein